MDGSLLSQQIQSALAPWNGAKLPMFAQAIGTGVVTALKGKLTFVTVDAGTMTGPGAGTGLGIKGMMPANIESQMKAAGAAAWASKGGPGAEWAGFCTKIATAVSTHLQTTAILTSTHAPVAIGVGKVSKYAGVTPDMMQAAILDAAPKSWAANEFANLAKAIATGVVGELLMHSPVDTVTIVGAPAPPPLPGAGVGSGLVT